MAITCAIVFDVVPAERSHFLALLEDVLDALRSEPPERDQFDGG